METRYLLWELDHTNEVDFSHSQASILMPLEDNTRSSYAEINLTLVTEIRSSVTVLAAPSVFFEYYLYLNSVLERLGFQRGWRHLASCSIGWRPG